MFDTLSDLRDSVNECLSELSCEYSFFISLGRPPADCNSIAFWYDGSARNRSDNGDCRTNVYDTDLMITITRCCASVDAELAFNPVNEEKDAKCFLDDLSALRNCLSCASSDSLSSHIISCGMIVSEVKADQEKYGGCYSADITIRIVEDDCC